MSGPEPGEGGKSRGATGHSQEGAGNTPGGEGSAPKGSSRERVLDALGAGGRTRRQVVTGLVILVLALLGFAVAGLFIFLPFLAPLLLATVFTSVSWPLYDRMRRRVGEERRGLASGLTCTLLVLLVFLPLAWVGWSLLGEAHTARQWLAPAIRDLSSPDAVALLEERRYEEWFTRAREAFASLQSEDEDGGENGDDGGDRKDGTDGEGGDDLQGPGDAGDAGDETRGEEGRDLSAFPPRPEGNGAGPGAADEATPQGGSEASDEGPPAPSRLPSPGDLLRLAGWATRAVGGLLAGVAGLVIKFCLMVFIMFYFFRDGPWLLRSLERSVPVEESTKRRVVDTFQRVSRSLIRGTLLTAGAQAVVAMLGFLIVGLPAAVFWGAMVGLASLVPVAGTALVTAPLVVTYSLSAGIWWQGLFLAVLAVGVAALDNLLRPLFLEEGLSLHPLWILLSILGGVSVFGGLGIVVGPMVVVFLGTFLALVTEGNAEASEPSASTPQGGEAR